MGLADEWFGRGGGRAASCLFVCATLTAGPSEIRFARHPARSVRPAGVVDGAGLNVLPPPLDAVRSAECDLPCRRGSSERC